MESEEDAKQPRDNNKENETAVDDRMKKLEQKQDEKYIMEWQTVSRILDRFLFIINCMCLAFALCYGYFTLFSS